MKTCNFVKANSLSINNSTFNLRKKIHSDIFNVDACEVKLNVRLYVLKAGYHNKLSADSY